MIQPERILRDLAKLWTDLAQPGHGAATATGVLRACAMTLIVAAEDAADAQSAGETLAELMHEHPSRTVMLKPGDTGELDARVFAQCWMPFGGRQQICCEQIEITASPASLNDVPVLLLGLLAPDLPVVLWCRGERWLDEDHRASLRPLADQLIDKIIVDSSRFADARTGFELIRSLMGQPYRLADLNWARLTGWREVIAHAFEFPEALQEAGEIHSVRIGYAGGVPSATVYYLAAWLKRALPRAEISLASVRPDGSGVRSVQIGELVFEAGESCTTIEVRNHGVVYTAVLPACSDYQAMREELAITRGDTIFEEVLALTAGLMPRA